MECGETFSSKFKLMQHLNAVQGGKNKNNERSPPKNQSKL